jgi:hypothetical protein
MEAKDRLFILLQQCKLTLSPQSSQRSPPKLARYETLLFFQDGIRATKNAAHNIQRI